jgi:hypothetical protein
MVHRLVDPSDPHSSQYEFDSSSSNCTLNPLSYAHIAQPGSLDTVSENAASNKEDILMQSQMFRTTDKAAFIGSQKTEIEGLQKFVVMDLHHISDLPPWACLLSSIWSYRRK